MFENVEVDLNLLSEQSKRNLARSDYEAFQEFMKQPDAQAKLDAVKERLRRENSPLLDIL